MATITIQTIEYDDHYICNVTVREGYSSTQHRVTLKKADYKRLTHTKVPPETLVKASFEFLLEREPKESILRSFDLTVIGRYFPKYAQEIVKRL
ncbi:MAG: hypothetical protein JW981_04955 [Anaerolineae bacterium]|nr:hypothetical protein [Anaerolineae bacterium]